MDSFKMKNKIIAICISAFIILVIVIFIIVNLIKHNEEKNSMDMQTIMKRVIEINNDEYYYDGLIMELTKKNRDWSKLPLSKKFLTKYDIIKGIFNNDDLYGYNVTNEITFCGFDELHNKDKNIVSIEVATGNGEERIAYKLHYIINDRYELDDIEVLETAPITRPDGSLVMYDKHLTLKNDYERIIEKLLYPTYVDLFAEGPFYNEVLPLSDNFKKKYPKYNTDGITNELGFNYAKYYPNYVEYHQSYEEAKKFKKDEDKNIFYGYTVFDDKMNIYKLSFILDKDNNIDDCIVELYKTEIGDFSDIFKDW